LFLTVVLFISYTGYKSIGYAEIDLTAEINRYMEMLTSGNIIQRTDAAKMIFRSNLTDQKLFEVVNEELLKGYQLKIRDRNHVDAMAWLCKALGSSGMSKYKETLEKIYKTSRSKVLNKYAKQGLNMLP